MRIAPCANLARRGRNLNSAGLEPAFIVALESLAIGIAQQTGAVADFGRDFGRGTNGLVLRDEREPAAKGGLVGRIGQAQKVGCAVAEPVAPNQRRPGMGQNSPNCLDTSLMPEMKDAPARLACVEETQNKCAEGCQGRERNTGSSFGGS